MRVVSVTLNTLSPTKFPLALPSFQGSPDLTHVATALHDLHLSHPKDIDDSWEFPSVESRPSSDSITKSYNLTRPSKEKRAAERKSAIWDLCVFVTLSVFNN